MSDLRAVLSARIAFVLIALAAFFRLLLHAGQMPPYAGLDEIYHVARIAFVSQEGRNPTVFERSIPRYLIDSMIRKPGSPPAFGVVGREWPHVVRSAPQTLGGPVRESERRQYSQPNYEAQQPSLYYTLIAAIAPAGSGPMRDLRIWRMFSVAFAMIVVVATAFIGDRLRGAAGWIAAVLVVSLPTWLTLTVRASNDALACAAIATALAITIAAPRRTGGWIFEGAAWGLAIATKLYAAPVSVVVPLLWWRQRPSWRRVFVVGVIYAAALAAVVGDLAGRTRNPIGHFGFDPVPAASATARLAIDWIEVAKIFVATAAWTSGQHWNALRLAPTLIYLGSIAALLAWAAARGWRREPDARHPLLAVAVAFGAFGFALFVSMLAFLRSARLAGQSLPAGGKEGWYFYAAAPLAAGVLLALLFSQLRERPLITAGVVAWFVAWDIALHEGALYRDWAALTSPDVPGWLVRWGSIPGVTEPVPLAVGPWPEAAIFWRALHVLFVTAVVALALRQQPSTA